MSTNSHPIEHSIVALLFLVEGVCWIINELAGFHVEPEVEDPRDTIAIEEPVPEILDVSFDGYTHGLSWDEYVDSYKLSDLKALTVKQLRKQAQGLAKNVHLMRKAQLVELLA